MFDEKFSWKWGKVQSGASGDLLDAHNELYRTRSKTQNWDATPNCRRRSSSGSTLFCDFKPKVEVHVMVTLRRRQLHRYLTLWLPVLEITRKKEQTGKPSNSIHVPVRGAVIGGRSSICIDHERANSTALPKERLLQSIAKHPDNQDWYNTLQTTPSQMQPNLLFSFWRDLRDAKQCKS